MTNPQSPNTRDQYTQEPTRANREQRQDSKNTAQRSQNNEQGNAPRGAEDEEA